MDESPLKELIREHDVHWESRPLAVMRNGSRTNVGYELDLAAAHGANHGKVDPGCPECQKLYRGLKSLAEAVFPPDDRRTRFEIGPFDYSWHLNPARRMRPEIVLRIAIVHREEYFDPIDESEERSLKEIEHRLKELGARRGQ